jgi:hypothetical protein
MLAILIIAASTAGQFGLAATPNSDPHKRRRPRTNRPGNEEFFLTIGRICPIVRSNFYRRRHDRTRQSAALVRDSRHERFAPPPDSSGINCVSLRRKCFMRQCRTDQTGAAARPRGTDRSGRRKRNSPLFPVRVGAFPVPRKRFPVPKRTGKLPEALRIAARFRVRRRQNGPKQTEFGKIPCSFPCFQGIQIARRGRQIAVTDARCCPA